MGRRDTGTEMDDESADALRLPEKPVVVDYARRVFARLQAVINALPEARIFTQSRAIPATTPTPITPCSTWTMSSGTSG